MTTIALVAAAALLAFIVGHLHGYAEAWRDHDAAERRGREWAKQPGVRLREEEVLILAERLEKYYR